MKLTPSLGGLGLWLKLDADALLVLGGFQQELEPRLISLCRTLRRLREQGETRQLIAPITITTASPLQSRLSDPGGVAALLTVMAGSLDIVRWMHAEDRWSELVGGLRLVDQPDSDAILDMLRADPRTGGLSADLLRDRLLETIQQAPCAHGERLLDAALLESVLAECQHDLHRWGEWRAHWRRALWIQALPPAEQSALSGRPCVLPTGLLTAPWQRTGRPRLPSRHLQHSRTPFTGQRAAIESLLRWMSSDDQYRECLLTGPSGSGKSRTMFEVCQALAEQGWSTGFLSDDPPADWLEHLAAEGDRLVVVDDAAERQEQLRMLRGIPAGSGRLRVVALSALVGWWSGDRITLQPIPPADRLTDLKLATATYADATGQQTPWMVRVPDTAVLRWPLGVQMAALLTVHRLPLDDVSAGILALERQVWRELGQDEAALSARVADRILGIHPPDADPGVEVLSPRALFDRVLVEQLRGDPTRLRAVRDCQTALLALCRIASAHPEALRWLSEVIAADPDTRTPIALSVARMIATDPATTPLGPLLTASGLSGVRALDVPLRGLTVSYCRQALLRREEAYGDPRSPVSLAMGTDAGSQRPGAHRSLNRPPPDRSGPIWEQLRLHLGVLLPHHIEALDALRDPHQRPLDAARMAALLRCSSQRRVCLELAVSQVGMDLSDPPSPDGSTALSESDLAVARSAVGLLKVACGLRIGPPDTLPSAREALAALRDHLDPDLPALAEALHQSGSIAGYTALIAPLEALIEGRLPCWPDPDILRADLALRHHLQGRAHTLPAVLPDHPPALRLLLRTVRIATGADPGEVLPEIIADLDRLPDLYRPIQVAVQDTAARWLLDHGDTEVAGSLLRAALQGLSDLRERRSVLLDPFLGLSLHNLGAQLFALDPDASIDATLSAAEAWRRQVRRSGEAFLPDLAATLGNLGAMLTRSERPEESLALIRKSISVCWGGVPADALGTMPGIRALLTSGTAPGEPPEGLLMQARQRAALTQSHPFFLWQISELAAELEQPEDGEGIIGLSRRIWEHHRATPEQLRPRLADALHNLGAALGASGQLSAAIEAAAGAVAVLDGLPGATIEHALALDNLSVLHGMAGERQEALAAAERAVKLLSGKAAPVEHAAALSNLSAALYDLGCHQRAAQIAMEAAGIEAASDTTRMMALFNLGLARAAAGEAVQAAEALQAALDLVASPPPCVRDCHRRISAAARASAEAPTLTATPMS